MCATCGCEGEVHEGHAHGDGDEHGREHGHGHGHGHEQDHDHVHGTRMVRIERDILEKNQAEATANRAWLAARRVVAINLLSAPGAGKTALLEATLRLLGTKLVVSVIEGDQETQRDAARIREAGGKAVQLNTGTGCHLDAHAVGHALRDLDPPRGSVVVVENVGNLVCPALFDLGERAKVVLLSVTEGEDKPVKYPHMFRASELLLLNKVDLLPHLRFDVDRCLAFAREVNPRQRVMQVSATTGQGLDGWCGWLGELARAAGAS